jgi:diacylglycerol kinase family enzyme
LCGKPLYGLIALCGGFYRIPFDITMQYRTTRTETRRLELPAGICEIIISNVRTYAGGVPLCSGCRMDDGKFEVTVVAGLRQWLALLPALLLQKPLNTLCPGLVQFQTDRLELNFCGRTFYQVDGELLDGFSGFSAGGNGNRLIVAADHQVDVIVPSGQGRYGLMQ